MIHDQALLAWKRTKLFCPVCGARGLVCTDEVGGWDGEPPEYYCSGCQGRTGLWVSADMVKDEVGPEYVAGYARFLELEAGAPPVETYDALPAEGDQHWAMSEYMARYVVAEANRILMAPQPLWAYFSGKVTGNDPR